MVYHSTFLPHFLINIFKNKHAEAVKFNMDNEKNMRNLLVSKSQKVGKNVKAIRLSSFKHALKWAIELVSYPFINCVQLHSAYRVVRVIPRMYTHKTHMQIRYDPF